MPDIQFIAINRLRRLAPWALVLFFSFGLHAAPRTPSDDAQLLEQLPFRAGDSTARELASLRAALAASPTDAVAALALAKRYYELAIARGDPRYIGYADALVSRFATNTPAAMLIMRGMLSQYRHGFAEALADFAAALRLDEDMAGANAWRGAIYLVQANYTAAAQECQALRDKQRVVLHGGCAGLLLAYSGHLAAAYKTLQDALAQTSEPDQQLWLHTRLGEVAAWQAKPALAEKHYRQALALGVDDGYLLAAWSDFLLDQNRPAEVIKQLANWTSSDGLLLRLAEAEARMKRPQAALHRQALADRFAAAKLRGDTTHRAEEARFELRLRGDVERSLALASANYAVQREPRDARVLLEAALAAKRMAAAKPALDWLARSGFEGQPLRQLSQQLFALPSLPSASGVSQ